MFSVEQYRANAAESRALLANPPCSPSEASKNDRAAKPPGTTMSLRIPKLVRALLTPVVLWIAGFAVLVGGAYYMLQNTFSFH